MIRMPKFRGVKACPYRIRSRRMEVPMFRLLRWTCGFLGVGLVFALPAMAQGRSQQADVYQAVAGNWSKQLHEMAPGTVNIPEAAQPVFLGRIPFSGSDAEGPSAAAQTTPLSYSTLAPVAGTGFDGLYSGAGGTPRYAPSDANGAAGTTQYVQWVNAVFAIYDKSTGAIVSNGGPFAGNTPWKGFGGGCETNNDGDPIVQFDKLAQRWVFTQFSVSNKPYLQCFAISQTADARGPYFRFAFSFGNSSFPDYPKLGIMPNGYFMSFNIFRNGFFFQGPRACAVDRNKALSGQAPVMICYSLSSSYGSLLPADLDGTTPPSDTTRDFFISYGSNSLLVWQMNPDFVTPSSSALSGPTTLAVSAFSRACSGGTCIPQPGTTQKLDSLADRLMYRLAYRKLGDGTESMVVNHSVTSSTAASAIRWYQLKVNGNTVTVNQQSTYAPADNIARWMGSVAMNKCGDIALGYSVSNASSVKPGIRATGRLASDPANQLQTETTLRDGTGSQLPNLSRWGDYASMTVDPVDDSTFWFTTQYMTTDGTFNWRTAIVPMKFSTCP